MTSHTNNEEKSCRSACTDPKKKKNSYSRGFWNHDFWTHSTVYLVATWLLCKFLNPTNKNGYLVERASSYNPNLISLVWQLCVNQPESWAKIRSQVVGASRGNSVGQAKPLLNNRNFHKVEMHSFKPNYSNPLLHNCISYLCLTLEYRGHQQVRRHRLYHPSHPNDHMSSPMTCSKK